MLHNSMIDLNKVSNNLKEAINSKLLNMGANSGRCEMHVAGFADLVKAHGIIEHWLKATEEEVTQEVVSEPSKDTKKK